MRLLLLLSISTSALAPRVTPQAPPTAPLALLLPASTRAAAMGNAGVAGRDDDVLFYNPAGLVNARGGFSATLARYGNSATLGAMTASFTGGPLSLGWGVQVVNYSSRPGAPYPFVPGALSNRGSVTALSLVAAVGAGTTYKGFRIGAAGKYAEDRFANDTGILATTAAVHGVFVGDIGLAHNLWNGVAGISVQNLGRNSVSGAARTDLPVQTSLGWTLIKQVGELDMGLAVQLTSRRGWISPGGGVEVGYGWIEGYAVALRAGAHRPETSAERPFGVGASLNADRLALEYALQFFDGGRAAHRMTFRWR